MRILAIDTATSCAGAAVADQKGVIAQFALQVGLTHSERFLPMLEALLLHSQCPLAEMDALAVTVGPGSFTGLRIGLATAKAFAQALDIPLVGVGTLDAYAAALGPVPELVCPVLDARKNEVYSALFAEGQMVEPPQAIAPLALAQSLLARGRRVLFTGDALPSYAEQFQAVLGPSFAAAPAHLRILPACGAALLGREKFLQGETTDAFSIAPVYLRASEAEIKLQQKGTRA